MDGISVSFSITNILLATFILSIILQISEGFNFDHKNYIKRDYRNLGRLRRQIVGPPCKGYDQFECSNGQCIHSDDECNGVAECDDKSDETEQGCHRFYCPDYLYKCEYGACVNGDAKCNGHQDCIDNSDEDEKICNTTTPRVNIDIPKDGKKCTTPEQPKHGQWIYSGSPRRPDPNDQVDPSTVIIFSCETGYKLSATNGPTLPVACEKSAEGKSAEWTITLAITCQKHCPSQYNTPLITMKCTNDGWVVPCDRASDNTILKYKCAPYYEKPYGKPDSSICFDASWDHTPECVPVCGKKRVSATPLIVNGKEVEKRGNYPWVVALYSNRDTDPYFTNICSGSLLTTNVVLTAAQCVANNQNGKLYPVRYYRVAAGKYYNQYNNTKDEDTAQYAEVSKVAPNGSCNITHDAARQFFFLNLAGHATACLDNVSDSGHTRTVEIIEVHREYRGEMQNYRGDIALLILKTDLALSIAVQPVCYNNLPALTANTNGLVVGWGYTAQSGQPAEKLQELELPYIDDAQCLDEFDSDFAQRYFTPDKLCAGFKNKSTSICKGDNGGGLVFRNPNYRQRFFIYGIVSLAHSYVKNQQVVCDIQQGALFTKVETYLSWIQLIIYKWSSNKT